MKSKLGYNKNINERLHVIFIEETHFIFSFIYSFLTSSNKIQEYVQSIMGQSGEGTRIIFECQNNHYSKHSNSKKEKVNLDNIKSFPISQVVKKIEKKNY